MNNGLRTLHRRPLVHVIAMLAVFVGVALWFATCGDRSLPEQKTTLVIAPGTTFAEAAIQAEHAGLARAWSLRFLERVHKRDVALSAGSFEFLPHRSTLEIYDELKSTALPVAHWVTIPEGYTATEIGERLQTAGFPKVGDFGAYARKHTIHIGGATSRSLEGYLFPSTYLIPNDADAKAVADMMVAEFRRQIPHDVQARAVRLHMSVPQIVTIASLIEREAKRDDERPLMAGVYYHRLAIAMPLEVDATLEYAFTKHHTVITARDLAQDTPYNSYKHAGLPPTPIANPGLPSLLAALQPVKTPYLYYVYRGGGRHAFAATLSEHNSNVARYLR